MGVGRYVLFAALIATGVAFLFMWLYPRMKNWFRRYQKNVEDMDKKLNPEDYKKKKV